MVKLLPIVFGGVKALLGGKPSRVLGEPIQVTFKYTTKFFLQVFYVDGRVVR
jgi:hypothetical protein